MRQVGIADNQPKATRFASYLVTQGIAAHAEQEPEGWAVWVRDEDHFDQARSEFQHFLETPNDTRYEGAEQKAEAIVRERVRQQAEAKKNVVEVRSQWNRPATRRAPLTFTLLGLCILVSLFTGFGKNEYWKELSFSTARNVDGLAGFADIKNGQVWRIVTPIFGHGDALHLLFNCYWLFILGSLIENSKGTLKLGILVLIGAVISNVLQAWFEGPNFLGISGVVCALFGYIWMKSLYAPGEGMQLNPMTIYIFVGYLFLCLTGLFGDRIANVAHFAGLGVGIVAGYAPILLRPRTGT